VKTRKKHRKPRGKSKIIGEKLGKIIENLEENHKNLVKN